MSKSLVRQSDPVRAIAITAQRSLIDAVTRFGAYVDHTGQGATSLKGLALSLNVAIKREYGLARDDMPRDMLLHLLSSIDRVLHIIERGEAEYTSRATIKAAIHDEIKASAASYHALVGGHHG